MTTGVGPVVVVGEALVDLLATEDGSISHRPGGGPYNAARTIARLGEPVVFLAGISKDRFGRELAQLLNTDGVDLRAAQRHDAPTTLALAELNGQGQAEYRFYLEGTAAPAVDYEQAAQELPHEPYALHVGTLGLVVEPLATTVDTLVQGAAPDTLIVVDPNCRPLATPDPDAFRERAFRILGAADVIKASDDDLAFLDPSGSPEATAERLAERGAVVILSRGGSGADVHAGGVVERFAAPAVEVADTVGAGDALLGAFVAESRRRGFGRDELADPVAVGEVARFALWVASDTCSRIGADPPRRADLPFGDSGPPV